MWRRIHTVFCKEVLDNARDRRSLLVALIYPLMGPILLGLIISMVSSVIGGGVSGETHRLRLHVQGAEYGSDLTAYLKSRVVVAPAPEKPEEAVRLGKVNVILVIPEDFSQLFQSQRTAKVKVIANTSRLPGLMAINQVAIMLGDFNQEVWGRRIAEKGVDLKGLQPLSIESVNMSKGTQITDLLLFMVPPLIIFNVFMGGVYLSIDTTSGERERNSLEPLLINPIERWGLMLGKFLAALLFTVAAVLVQLVAFKVAFEYFGGPESVFAHTLNALTFLGVFLTALPLMMLAVGVQFIIATITRSFKEAQTYLGLLPLVPALPGLVLIFAPVEAQSWMMTIPTFSQTLLFSQFLQGETVGAFNFMVSFVTTMALALIAIAIAAGLYEREKLIFGE